MSQSRVAEHFDEIGEYDSKAIFKPTVPALVVSNSKDEGPNIMTASWWMLAGYNPFRYLLAVSQKTYTHDIIESSQEFVLAAPSTELIDAVTLAGMVSGREIDKIEHLDLETIPGQSVDVPLLADAVGNIEMLVMNSFEFEGTTYFFGSVERAYVSTDALDGRILSLDADILAYMGSDWGPESEKSKDRYYATLDPAQLESFPGDEIVDSLPPELRDKYAE